MIHVSNRADWETFWVTKWITLKNRDLIFLLLTTTYQPFQNVAEIPWGCHFYDVFETLRTA